MTRKKDEISGLANSLIEGISDGTVRVRPTDDDIETSERVAKLTPKAQRELTQQQLRQQLEERFHDLSGRHDSQSVELNELRQVKVNYEILKRSHRSTKIISSICTVGMAVGGGLISSFAKLDWQWAVGWAFLCFGAVISITILALPAESK